MTQSPAPITRPHFDTLEFELPNIYQLPVEDRRAYLWRCTPHPPITNTLNAAVAVQEASRRIYNFIETTPPCQSIGYFLYSLLRRRGRGNCIYHGQSSESCCPLTKWITKKTRAWKIAAQANLCTGRRSARGRESEEE